MRLFVCRFKDGYPVRPHHNINFINSPGGIIGIHFDKVTLHDAGKYSCTIANRLGELEATAVVEVEGKIYPY
jgi:Immunoglobulin I-set domain